MQLKCKTKKEKKRFVQCTEKVLGQTECVKSGLWSFVLEVSPWTMLHAWSGRPVEVANDQIETSIESNQLYTTWKIADILKISKSTKLLVKMKHVSFTLQEKLNRLFGQPDTCSDGGAHSQISNVKRARRMLGWMPRPTPPAGQTPSAALVFWPGLDFSTALSLVLFFPLLPFSWS